VGDEIFHRTGFRHTIPSFHRSRYDRRNLDQPSDAVAGLFNSVGLAPTAGAIGSSFFNFNLTH